MPRRALPVVYFLAAYSAPAVDELARINCISVFSFIDDSKSSSFYLLVIGVPVLVLLIIVVAILLYFRFARDKKNRKDRGGEKMHASIHNNKVYLLNS